jgi:hypothetical protein
MSFPYGWTKDDIDLGIDVARSVDASPRDTFALWYFESGLNPRIVSNAGYYGLIQGRADTLGPKYVSIVQGGSIAQQLEMIARVWQSSAQSNLGESYASRARKLGVTTPALIYAMNTCPAVVKGVRSADEHMFVRGAPGYPGMCYGGNPVFDHQNKGYITLRDYEDHLAAARRRGETTAPVNTIFAALPQDSALTSLWRKPAGKVAIAAVGSIAVLTAAFYVAYGRLPTRRDIGV